MLNLLEPICNAGMPKRDVVNIIVLSEINGSSKISSSSAYYVPTAVAQAFA
jgi:hypothetical protein